MKKRKVIYLSLLMIGMFTLLFSNCKKDENETLAELTTTEISEIGATTASGGGNITSSGGVSISQIGVCWSKSQNPTISDNKTEDGSKTGNFVSKLTGLEQGTMYYVKAYATTSNGTAYGNEVSFTTITQEQSYLSATIDGVNYNASSITIVNGQGKIGISGLDGTSNIIVWLPNNITIGAHSTSMVGDYVINYLPSPGIFYISSSGTINISEYNASTGKIVGTFNCTAQSSNSSKTISNGSFLTYK